MTFASSSPAASDDANPSTQTAADADHVSSQVPTQAPEPEPSNDHKRPRQPRYITPRAPDGLLMYARRIPEDINNSSAASIVGLSRSPSR